MQPQGQPLRKDDWWIATAFFVVALALRVPFRSQFAYHWDSAEFALAISKYNVALSQPHAPGYFLYVMLGRMVNWFVGDPHTSLVWMSIVAGSGLITLLYVLGVEMFGRRVGLAAALFAMTSPQVWFHSCVALSYIVDGFLVCLAVLCCWRAQRHGCRWVDTIMIGGMLAVVGGVRPQTVPGLMPLAVYALWRAVDKRLSKLAVAFCICVVGTLAWLIPMLRMTGGCAVYTEVFRRHAINDAPSHVGRGRNRRVLIERFFCGSLLLEWTGVRASIAGGCVNHEGANARWS